MLNQFMSLCKAPRDKFDCNDLLINDVKLNWLSVCVHVRILDVATFMVIVV